jgi:hypothetical protein
MGFIERYFLNDINETPQSRPVDTTPPPAGGGIVPKEKYTQDSIDRLQVQQNNIEKVKDPFLNVTPDTDRLQVEQNNTKKIKSPSGRFSDVRPDVDRVDIVDTTNVTKQVSNDEKADEIIINILSSISGEVGNATVLNNGIPLEGATPKRYSIKKSDLFSKGPQTIEVRKFGFVSNEKYIFSVNSRAGNPNRIDEIQILQDEQNPDKIIGLENLVVDVVKSVDGERRDFVLENGNYVNITFNLRRPKDDGVDISLPEENENVEVSTMQINLDGPDSSVKITSRGESDFLEKGGDEIKDKYGTKFFIETSSPKLYRISQIIITDSNGKQELLTAAADQSLSTEIVLDGDTNLDITSKRLVKVQNRKPIIRLKSADVKTYNINDKTDIPLIIEKNDAVRAISVIIGDEILEFDNLKKGQYVGIELPHRLLEKIGQYNIKLFPFSIEELSKGEKEKDVTPYDNLPDVDISEVPSPRPFVPVETPTPIETSIREELPVANKTPKPRPFVPTNNPLGGRQKRGNDTPSRRPFTKPQEPTRRGNLRGNLGPRGGNDRRNLL